jgi:sulfoxide reductase heme-binding subunit YedZ
MNKHTILISSLLSATLLFIVIFFIGDFAGPAQYWANLSAHLAFYYFFVAFVSGPVSQVFGNSFAMTLLRNRRYFGLAFAVTHSFHLIALVYFFWVTDESPEMLSIMGGGFGYLLLYGMAITSSGKMIKMLGLRRWKILHSTGMHYFALIFLATFALRFVDDNFNLIYGLYVLLLLFVYSIRIFVLKRL